MTTPMPHDENEPILVSTSLKKYRKGIDILSTGHDFEMSIIDHRLFLWHKTAILGGMFDTWLILWKVKETALRHCNYIDLSAKMRIQEF